MTADPVPEELTREKNLWDVYQNSRRLPRNRLWMLFAVCVLVVDVAYWTAADAKLADAIEHFHAVVDEGIGLVRSVLGFMLAGFTIFLTVTRQGLFLSLAKARHKSGYSYLQNALYIFLRVFILYLVVLVWCLLLRFFAWPSGPLPTAMLSATGPEWDRVNRFVVSLAAGTTASLVVYAVLLLGSFIFNVYATVLAGLRWDWEAEIDEKRDAETREQTPEKRN